MLAWIAYALALSVLFSAAAFAAERAARLRQRANRWIWVIALGASLLAPAAIPSVVIAVPGILRADGQAGVLPLREITSARLTAAIWAPQPSASRPLIADLDATLRTAWAGLSLLLSTLVLAGAVHLHRRRRHWPQAMMAGSPVRVAPDAGPAVVGLLRPEIVVPHWLTASPLRQQALVMAHEQSHLAARDPQLLYLAVGLVLLMPWNLPMWWQMRRLRHAIEVDCDARVLAGGCDLQDYGAALIDVGRRRSGFVVVGVAMAESNSLLEQRIGIMAGAPRRWARPAALGCAGIAICLAVFAARVGPPPAARHQFAVAAGVLAEYDGFYRFGEMDFMSVTHDGERLFTQLASQKPVEIFAEGEAQFFARVVDVHLAFVRDAHGRIAAMSLRQGGATFTAPRIDAAQAEQMHGKLLERIGRNEATPGGAERLQRGLDAVLEGRLLPDDLTPELFAQMMPSMPEMRKQVSTFGKVKTIQFLRVGPDGWEAYRVEHDHAVIEWSIAVNADGRIAHVRYAATN